MYKLTVYHKIIINKEIHYRVWIKHESQFKIELILLRNKQKSLCDYAGSVIIRKLNK